MSNGDKGVIDMINTPNEEPIAFKHKLTDEFADALISKLVFEGEFDDKTKRDLDKFTYWYSGFSKNKAESELLNTMIKEHKPYIDELVGWMPEEEFKETWSKYVPKIAERWKLPAYKKEEAVSRDSSIYAESIKSDGLEYPDINEYFLYLKNYRKPRKDAGVPYMSYEKFKYAKGD